MEKINYKLVRKKHNCYWIYDYGSVIPFFYEYIDEDGNVLKKSKEVHKGHIGREELEEYIEILKIALEKKKKWDRDNIKQKKL